MMNKIDYYVLGQFAADLLSSGIIYPDFKLDNLGRSNNRFVIVDSHRMEKFNFPDDFTHKVIRRTATSLLTLSYDFRSSFTLNSYFRAGYMIETGFSGLLIYDKLYSSEYSSLYYAKPELVQNERKCHDITDEEEIKKLIVEWKNIDFQESIIHNYKNVVNYKTCKTRKSIKHTLNKYSLDTSYFINASILYILGNNISSNEMADILLFFSEESLNFRRFYTAYGLAKRCKLLSKDKAVCNKCDNIILATQPYVLKYASVINKYLNNDIFELLWITDDLDRIL